MQNDQPKKINFMKKGILLSLIFIIAMTVNIGCDALDVVEEITFDIEMTAQSDVAAYAAEYLLMADSLSSEIEEYSNLIKKIELIEVTFQIVSVGAGNEALKINSATLNVAAEDGSGQQNVATVTDQNIAVMNTPVALPLNQAGMDRFAELIKASPHHALILMAGTADSAPVDFTVKFFFKIKMTANPL